jgi:hypothetical protein
MSARKYASRYEKLKKEREREREREREKVDKLIEPQRKALNKFVISNKQNT